MDFKTKNIPDKTAGKNSSLTGPEKRKPRYAPVSPLLFTLILLIAFLWMLFNIHPDSSIRKSSQTKEVTNLTIRSESALNNLKSEALSDVVYIRKIYKIPEDLSVAPVPDSSRFGETDDPGTIQRLIDDSAELLEGQDMVWNSNIDFYPGSVIKYYCDDSILCIVWKEAVSNTVCTFSEVKIADGSQLRRALAGDSYSSSIQLKASDMAKAVNSVVAINGDFYAFRQIGVVVYKRELFRFSPSALDTCFFTASGKMLFAHKGELTTDEATKQYIADNDIIFSASFGPILVENGEIYQTASYPVGEVFNYYARSAIGTTDDLHYLLMVTSSENSYSYIDGMYASTAARIMFEKGCVKAYELDGGQTAVIVFNGMPANGIVYGSERTMSDILYFASAIPEEAR